MNSNLERKVEEYIDRQEREARREGLERMAKELRASMPKPKTIPGATVARKMTEKK